MDSNIWFYTFSASSQVMAALVGLFAIFVVYKIQEFSTLLYEVREATIRILTYSSANTENYTNIQTHETVSMTDFQLLNKFEELLNIKLSEPERVSARETIHMGTISYTLNQLSFDFFKRLVTKKVEILKRLKRNLILSFFVIFVAILALVLTEVIFCELFLWVFTTFFSYTLFELARGIYWITAQ